jgi:O-antigen/teichoic acid export membrane protein
VVFRLCLMFRNVVFLLGGYVVSWAISLLYWLVIPRSVGPVGWGELNLGWAIAGVAFAAGSLGIPTFLIKQMSRDATNRSVYLGAGLATHLVLSVFILGAVFLFVFGAGYGSHTRSVVLVVSCILMCNFIAQPAISALQAMEKMHLNSIVLGVRQVTATSIVVLIEVIFRVDVIVLTVVFLAFSGLATVLQLLVTNRHVHVGLTLNPGFTRHLVVSGFPFWSNGVFLTIYVWIDSVLLSMLASTREVGYYAAPTQLIQTLGFLPALITTVVFPALSSSFYTDQERLRRLTRVSLGMLLTFGLPISVGVAMVGPRALGMVFGPAFQPSATVLVVLAFTVVPSYIATLAYWVLAAMDRERLWAVVMGSVAVANPLLNLVAIPLFQSRYGQGSLGAAWALLMTDSTVCAAGLVLTARVWLPATTSLLKTTGKVLLATTVMAVPVMLLRDDFLPVAVLAGGGVFTVTAYALGVFRGEGYADAWAAVRLRLRQRFGRRVEVSARVA